MCCSPWGSKESDMTDLKSGRALSMTIPEVLREINE